MHPSSTVFPHGRFLGHAQASGSAGGFLLARMVPTVPEHEVHEHTHAEAHFVLLLGGAYLSSAHGAPAVAHGPLLVYNPPGTVHRDRFQGDGAGGAFMTVTVGTETLRDHADAVALPDHPCVVDLSAVSAAGRLTHWAGGPEHLLAESLCVELLDAAARPLQQARLAMPPWLWRVREQLHDACEADFALRDLAATAGVHAVHVTRSFRRHFGCTPGDYLRRCRLARAAALLRTSRLSLAEVAVGCGYFDQAHFTRSFHAAFGQVPRAYRREHITV